MIQLGISGCKGRMGQAITALALRQPDTFQIKTLLESPDSPCQGEDVKGIRIQTDNRHIENCHALIEFTLPEGTLANLEAAVKYHVPMVIGTTGFDADQLKIIGQAAAKIPIVFSSNMSIGVNILFKLIEITAAKIGAQHIRLQETHHIHKKDKPSGTAKTMAEIAEKHSKQKVDGIEAFREGEVIGDHDITFESAEDILTLRHHAKDRSMFAKGALTAAQFLQGKHPGLYHMQDVLGLDSIKI